MNKSLAAAAVLVSTLTGCMSHRVLDVTMISTKNIELSQTPHRVDTSVRVTGVDERKMYFLGSAVDMPDLKEAIDNAIEKNNGCVALLNAVVTYKECWIPFVLGQTSFEVEGNPVYADKK